MATVCGESQQQTIPTCEGRENISYIACMSVNGILDVKTVRDLAMVTLSMTLYTKIYCHT